MSALTATMSCGRELSFVSIALNPARLSYERGLLGLELGRPSSADECPLMAQLEISSTSDVCPQRAATQTWSRPLIEIRNYLKLAASTKILGATMERSTPMKSDPPGALPSKKEVPKRSSPRSQPEREGYR